MRTICVFRINDSFAEYCHLSIQPAINFCNGVCFLTDRITRTEVQNIITSSPSILMSREVSQPWDHAASLREAYYLGMEYDADWVLIPDHDEILPYDFLDSQLRIATDRNKWVMAFPFLNCWGNSLTIVDPKLNATGYHGKAYRSGIPDFQDNHFCIPRGYWDSNLIHDCEYPLRHCHMMTLELRDRRQSQGRGLEPWAHSKPKTFPFHPNWTFFQYSSELKYDSSESLPDSYEIELEQSNGTTHKSIPSFLLRSDCPHEEIPIPETKCVVEDPMRCRVVGWELWKEPNAN